MIVPSNEIAALLSCVFLLVRHFIVRHRLFALLPNSYFSRYVLHFVRMWSLTIFLICRSSGLVTRNASRSSGNLVALVGKLGLISDIYPAEIYLLAASVILFRNCFSPIWMSPMLPVYHNHKRGNIMRVFS